MDASAIAAVLDDLKNWGPLGLLVAALISGQVVPGWAYRKSERDCQSWKGLYESEREAHQHTRDAYQIQGERLQVAVESGKVTEQLLREARSRVATTTPE